MWPPPVHPHLQKGRGRLGKATHSPGKGRWVLNISVLQNPITCGHPLKSLCQATWRSVLLQCLSRGPPPRGYSQMPSRGSSIRSIHQYRSLPCLSPLLPPTEAATTSPCSSWVKLLLFGATIKAAARETLHFWYRREKLLQR